jgi:hypothetical protein
MADCGRLFPLGRRPIALWLLLFDGRREEEELIGILDVDADKLLRWPI